VVGNWGREMKKLLRFFWKYLGWFLAVVALGLWVYHLDAMKSKDAEFTEEMIRAIKSPKW